MESRIDLSRPHTANKAVSWPLQVTTRDRHTTSIETVGAVRRDKTVKESMIRDQIKISIIDLSRLHTTSQPLQIRAMCMLEALVSACHRILTSVLKLHCFGVSR